MAELILEAAEVFQANQITAGHAVLIARLPQEQQKQALDAAFREDWRSKEKHVISVRELAQWIRENLMLNWRMRYLTGRTLSWFPKPERASRVRSGPEPTPHSLMISRKMIGVSMRPAFKRK